MSTPTVSTMSVPERLARSLRIKPHERYKENSAARRNTIPQEDREALEAAGKPTFEGVGRRTFLAAQRFAPKATTDKKRNRRAFSDDVIVAE